MRLACVLVLLAAVVAIPSTTSATGSTSAAIVFAGGPVCGSRACENDPRHNSRIFVLESVGGRARAITTIASDSNSPAWSPDRRRIVFTRGFRLWIMNADGSGARRLTRGDRVDTEADWSPDGRRIVFRSESRSGASFDLYVINQDGTGLRNLTRHPDDVLARDPAWSPDGRWIAFERYRQDRGGGVYRMRPDGTGLKRLVIDGAEPDWSPDGRRLAFYRFEDGPILYTSTAGGRGLRRLAPGTSAAWEPNGRRIAFVTPNGRLAVIPASGGRPRELTTRANFVDSADW